MLTGDNNGMNKFLKETLSTDWQTFAKGLNISGVSMEDFGNTYSNVYTKLGKDSKVANTQLKKFFAMGGDAISTTKKIAAASDLMEGYGEVAQKLTDGIWDTNDMDNYTDSYLKNMHILMKTAKMNDQEAMDSAKQIATLTSMLQSNNNQALIFDDEDTFQRLITTGGLFQNTFENSGDFQKMLKEEGFAGVIGKLQQKFVGADGVS